MPATARNRRRGTGTRSSASGGFGVKEPITNRRQREAAEMGAMVSRMCRALRRRAEAGDLEIMRAFVQVTISAKVEMGLAARALHEEHGYAWTEIGWAAGITKQAAYERWGS